MLMLSFIMSKLLTLLMFCISWCVFANTSTHELNLQNQNSLLDLYTIDLDGDGSDELIITTINMKHRQLKSNLLVYKEDDNGKFVDVTSKYFAVPPRFFHARHVLWIPQFENNTPALFVSDHGIDLPPYAGGISRIYVLDLKLNKFIDKTHEFKLDNLLTYTFASTFSHLEKDKKLIIFKANMQNKSQSIEFLSKDNQNKFSNETKKAIIFPDEKCFMNALFADLDHSGNDQLILGGCDLPQKSTNFIDHDIILKRINGQYKSWIELPLRNSEPQWGVNAIYAKNLSKNISLDLIELIYNNSYTQGKVNFYQDLSGNKFSKVYQFTPKNIAFNYFIPWIAFYDVDGDGLLDIVGTYRFSDEYIHAPKKFESIFVLKNTANGFVEIKNDFQLPHNKFFVNVANYKSKNRNGLVFLDYTGHVYVVH